MEYLFCDVLVVGSGAAGLRAVISVGELLFYPRDAFERIQNGSKLMSKVGQKGGVRARLFYRGLI
jgi:predicted flavoprotein YhiN